MQLLVIIMVGGMENLLKGMSSCPHVSTEVRKTIAQQLQEYHSEKAAKQRRKEELEERIKLGDRGDYGDSGYDDELTIARRESMMSQVEWEERERRRARIDQDQFLKLEKLPEELLNEIDEQNVDEETQCDNMDDISPAQSNEESIQLLTSSGGEVMILMEIMKMHAKQNLNTCILTHFMEAKVHRHIV
ncbi:hypothetical protein GOBAR_AA34095 [Gossypium barbadense]|uniref:Uncharacterized protein n=1 Tax=Gossypium barbadense TaxID=3634 RepID=A0A2P5W686_GOSBA|nr:hypothetical protein GOBAR_AA34095 [Gossypium barbadense]